MSHSLLFGVLLSALAGVLCATPAHGACCLTVSGVLTISGTLTTDCVDVKPAGRIIICGGTLVLNGNNGKDTSTIDGRIELRDSASTLRVVSNSHTFAGSGFIRGLCGSARIEIASGKTLTSATTIEGAMRIEPASGTATFVNGSGGLVRANTAGTLDIRPGIVTGSGAWEVSSNDDAVLQFTTGSQSLSGSVTVSAGTLDILGDVTTTGTLDFQQSPSFSAPEIHVASGHTFSAGGS